MDMLVTGKAVGSVPGGSFAPTKAQGGFSEMLEGVLKDTLTTGADADRQVLAAVENKADLPNVVAAISSAEVTLQAIVAVRDKVIAAYQELMRMPI